MRLRNTLLLAIIFILLGAYVYFFELKQGWKEKSGKLLDFKEEEVASIALSYPQREIRLTKDSGKWEIIEPLQAAADETTVTHILSALKTSEVNRIVEEKPNLEDLKNFGLDNPQVKVLITLKDGKALPPVLVGGKSPVGSAVYVRRGGEIQVLLTSAALLSSLEKKLNDFRDKRILEFKEDVLKRLAFKGAKGEWTLIKRGEEWFIEGARSYRADQFEVKALLSAIRNMSAQDFLEESPASMKRYGLDKPRLQVTLFKGEKDGQREILFGNKREGRDEVYATLDSKRTIYTVHESVFKQVDKDLSAFRDKQILSFPRDRVFKLGIQTPKDSLILAKGGDGEWEMEAPKKARMKPGVVENYITALGTLRAKAFIDDQPKDIKKYGLHSPLVKIAIADQDGKNLGTLLVGRKAAEGYYARLEENPAVYLIEESAYNQITKRLSDFLPPSP